MNLHRLLSRLQAGEFVYEQPAFPEVEYIFKHALTQEVAYNSLLMERRKVLHERTAQAIEEVYRHRLDDHYSELAYHYSRSGNTQKAVDYLQLAGQQAVQRSANAEAISHLTTALDCSQTLPSTAERIQKELALHIALGGPLMATKGYAAPEVEQPTPGHRNCASRSARPRSFSPCYGGCGISILLGLITQTARSWETQSLALAHKVQDPALLMEAHFALGGTIADARRVEPQPEITLSKGVALYDPQAAPCPCLFLRSRSEGQFAGPMAWALWDLGYPDQALKSITEALSVSPRTCPSLQLRLLRLASLPWIHQYRRERPC